MEFIAQPNDAQWIDIPPEAGARFQTLEECADYAHQLAEARGIVWHTFRFPDHLIRLIPDAGSVRDSARAFSGAAFLGAAGVARHTEEPEPRPCKSNRRTIIGKVGVVAAVLSVLGFGFFRPKSTLASCGCYTWWFPDEYCVWQSYCGGLGIRVYRLWYTFDTFGGCDSYCYSQLWSVNCC